MGSKLTPHQLLSFFLLRAESLVRQPDISTPKSEFHSILKPIHPHMVKNSLLQGTQYRQTSQRSFIFRFVFSIKIKIKKMLPTSFHYQPFIWRREGIMWPLANCLSLVWGPVITNIFKWD